MIFMFEIIAIVQIAIQFQNPPSNAEFIHYAYEVGKKKRMVIRNRKKLVHVA